MPFRDSQVQSVYNAAAFSIAQFNDRNLAIYLKEALLEPEFRNLNRLVIESTKNPFVPSSQVSKLPNLIRQKILSR